MSGRTKAAIRGAMLAWARETSGHTLEDAAGRMGRGFTPERLLAFERGDRQPTLAQARKLADIYGRPLGILYLPVPPEEPDLPADYRLGSTVAEAGVSPRLRKLVRRMHDLRATALDLAEDLDELEERFPPIRIRATLDEAAEAAAARARRWLGISIAQQRGWRDPKKAFAEWRAALERVGVLVYVELGAHSVPADEVRGFCLAERRAPLIAVNNDDAKAARVFTLIHELGHLLLRESAMSADLELDDPGRTRASRVEAWCNRFAGAFLVPADALERDLRGRAMASVLSADPQRADESLDDGLLTLAADYAVSVEVVVRRFAIFGWIAGRHYAAWRDAWYRRHPFRETKRPKGKGGPSPARLAPTRFGMGFLSLVYSAYWSDAVSALEVGDLVGGKLKTVKALESDVRMHLVRAAAG